MAVSTDPGFMADYLIIYWRELCLVAVVIALPRQPGFPVHGIHTTGDNNT
jgi:hypothetical protein